VQRHGIVDADPVKILGPQNNGVINHHLKPLDCIQKKFSKFILVLFVRQQAGELVFSLDWEQRRVDGCQLGCDKRIAVAVLAVDWYISCSCISRKTGFRSRKAGSGIRRLGKKW